jgi:hypothetical protein
MVGGFSVLNEVMPSNASGALLGVKQPCCQINFILGFSGPDN